MHPLLQQQPDTTSFNKLRKRLVRQVQQAIADFTMAREGEKWLICLSGGKDSWSLLGLLLDLQSRGELPVEILACNLDQVQPGFPSDTIPNYLSKFNIPHRIEKRDTYSIVTQKIPEGKTYCSLCSRLRRGNLYRVAKEENCSSIVLGHHREDILETFFMNMFHGGKLATMPPILLNDEGDLNVLRPLAYCAESDLEKYAAHMAFPIIPCDLCGSQDGLQRKIIKQMLNEMEQKHPGRKETIFKALADINPSHMLDLSLFDFQKLLPNEREKNAQS